MLTQFAVLGVASSNYPRCGANAHQLAALARTLYDQVADTSDPALGRLARAYELDADNPRDLLQDIPSVLPQLRVF